MTVAGKTGTTTSDNDRWFAGFTPYYTGVVWCGYDEPEEVILTNSSTNPAAFLWQKVMALVYEGLDNQQFSQPTDVISCRYCQDSGLLATDACRKDIRGAREVYGLPALMMRRRLTAMPMDWFPSVMNPIWWPMSTAPRWWAIPCMRWECLTLYAHSPGRASVWWISSMSSQNRRCRQGITRLEYCGRACQPGVCYLHTEESLPPTRKSRRIRMEKLTQTGFSRLWDGEPGQTFRQSSLPVESYERRPTRDLPPDQSTKGRTASPWPGRRAVRQSDDRRIVNGT